MIRKIKNFLLLPLTKKRLLIRSLLLVCLIRLGLWIVPYRRLVKWLNKPRTSKINSPSTDWKKIKEVSKAVRTTARYIPLASCLTQALATQTLLRLDGQKSNLKFGVDKDENKKLIAHAWIEVDGRIIIGGSPDIRRYAVLNSKKEQLV